MNIRTTVSYLASGLFLLLFSAACVCSPPDSSKPVVDGSKPEQQVDDGGSVDMAGQEVIVEEGSSVVEGGGEVIVEEKTEYSFQPPGNYQDNKLQMSSLPSAHVWKYLASFSDEPKNYATYSYVLTGRNGGDKYIELVNFIQGSTASAEGMAESKILSPDELNIFLIPALNTDGSAYNS
uniref:hypothetical protein n=1 Tax=Candidatus Electronema sp. TaxID=2698783 RepID=UPI004056EF39